MIYAGVDKLQGPGRDSWGSFWSLHFLLRAAEIWSRYTIQNSDNILRSICGSKLPLVISVSEWIHREWNTELTSLSK